MKFKLKQEKLEILLEKLLVKDIMPSSIISVKEDKLYSIQREEHARALRFLSVNKNFFEEFDCPKEESIEIDINVVLGIVKNILPNTMLTVETKDSKETEDSSLLITGKNVDAHLAVREPETITKELPFGLKDGVPLIGDEKIPLDIHFEIDSSELKQYAGCGSSLKTEFYGMDIIEKDGENKIEVRVGDVHSFDNFVLFRPISGKINKGIKLNVVFSYAIPQIAATFQKNVEIKTATDAPAWFYEKTDEYVLGVLVPPYTEDEDE